MAEQAFFEYHMYTLQRPSTVADNEVKQLELFEPVREMKVAKKYLYEPMFGYRWHGSVNQQRSYGVTSPRKVQVFVEFKNSQENNANLGIPLPAGKVRVFKQDQADKALEFIGEEKIDHTPKDEELSLQIGNAFDLVGEWTQKDWYINVNGSLIRETIEVKLRNHKKEDVTIRVKAPMYRALNWKMLDCKMGGKDFEYKKLDAFNVAFEVPVPAEKEGQKGKNEAVLTFQVEYTW